jgi:glycosyltransferase involved in cell wall biosynthesis
MCEAFATANYRLPTSNDVELWVPKRFNKIKEDPFEYYNIEKNFKIRKIPCIDFLVINKGPLGFWLTEISFLFFVAFYLIGSKEDIIYTRDKFVAFFLSFFKNNIYLEEHTVPAKLFFLRIKKLRGIILVTNNLKKIFQKRGVASEKILVAPDGVDLEEFNIKESQEECREKLGLPLYTKIVLYTGSLLPWKGVDTLYKATKYLSRDVIVYIAGGSEKDFQIFNFQFSIFKHITHRPHSEMPYWLKAADMLVLPNSGKYDISKYWTSPLKLFEYMASNRPIVASALPSIREVLNQRNSILVEPDNPENLANGIEKVLNDKELGDRISKQAFVEVQNYTWSKRAKCIEEIFLKKK